MKRVIFALSVLFLIIPINSTISLCQSNSSSDQNGYSELEKINFTDKITFHITPEKNITKKGKFVNILLDIKNNSNQKIEIDSRLNFHVEDISRNIKLPKSSFSPFWISIKEGKNRLSIINPFNIVNYKDEIAYPSIPWGYVKEGRYRIYFSVVSKDGIIKSNEIEIEVLKLNEEEELLFQQLLGNTKVKQSKEDRNNLFNQYKNTFFDEESYYLYGGVSLDILSKENHPERAQIIERLKEHLIKFPYSSVSSRLMRSLDRDFDDCRRAIEEIVEVLKLESPESWLLKIIENNKQLKEELKH
jgi:hypothetical protein